MTREVNGIKTRQDERRIYNPIQKDYATFLKTSEETGGEYTVFELRVRPHGFVAAGDHVHPLAEETF